MTPIRLLLVEPAFDEASFLQQALEEIQETVHDSWVAFEVVHVETLDEARAVAASEKPAVILLDVNLPGTPALTAFRDLRDSSPDVPIVLLIGRGDDILARRLLRDGAQDYLVKEEIDCAPLARSIRNAIDRQRFFNATHSGSSFDELTGLHNERGFLAEATRELHLAAGAGQSLALVLADVDNLGDITRAYGSEQRELTLLEAADILRDSFGPAALLACLGASRFAAMVWNQRPEDAVNRILHRVTAQPRAFAFSFGWAVTHPGAMESIDPLLSSAEASLCENGQSYQFPTAPSRSTQPTVSAPLSRA